jgi:hypothetical protein
MTLELEHLIGNYKQLREDARDYALGFLIPKLSKAVLLKGEADQDTRTLLQLAKWDPGAQRMRCTTPEFRRYSEVVGRMTTEADCQLRTINNACYPLPEILSMMLEQCDYWETDTACIIELAVAYLNDELKRSY